jgi:hypothetical protein
LAYAIQRAGIDRNVAEQIAVEIEKLVHDKRRDKA